MVMASRMQGRRAARLETSAGELLTNLPKNDYLYMKTLIYAGFTTILATGTLAFGQGAPDKAIDAVPAPKSEKNADHNKAPVPPATEAEFVQKAAMAGMSEVKLARLAVKKADDAKVKELAQMLVKDHTAANEELTAAAKKADITIKEMEDPKGDAKWAELNKMEGTAFDTGFLESMAMCHQMDIALLEAGRKVSTSEEIVMFIDKTTPVIKAHAAKIKTLQPGVRKDGDTTDDGEPRPRSTPPAVDPAPQKETPRTDAPEKRKGLPE